MVLFRLGCSLVIVWSLVMLGIPEAVANNTSISQKKISELAGDISVSAEELNKEIQMNEQNSLTAIEN